MNLSSALPARIFLNILVGGFAICALCVSCTSGTSPNDNAPSMPPAPPVTDVPIPPKNATQATAQAVVRDGGFEEAILCDTSSGQPRALSLARYELARFDKSSVAPQLKAAKNWTEALKIALDRWNLQAPFTARDIRLQWPRVPQTSAKVEDHTLPPTELDETKAPKDIALIPHGCSLVPMLALEASEKGYVFNGAIWAMLEPVDQAALLIQLSITEKTVQLGAKDSVVARRYTRMLLDGKVPTFTDVRAVTKLLGPSNEMEIGFENGDGVILEVPRYSEFDKAPLSETAVAYMLAGGERINSRIKYWSQNQTKIGIIRSLTETEKPRSSLIGLVYHENPQVLGFSKDIVDYQFDLGYSQNEIEFASSIDTPLTYKGFDVVCGAGEAIRVEQASNTGSWNYDSRNSHLLACGRNGLKSVKVKLADKDYFFKAMMNWSYLMISEPSDIEFGLYRFLVAPNTSVKKSRSENAVVLVNDLSFSKVKVKTANGACDMSVTTLFQLADVLRLGGELGAECEAKTPLTGAKDIIVKGAGSAVVDAKTGFIRQIITYQDDALKIARFEKLSVMAFGQKLKADAAVFDDAGNLVCLSNVDSLGVKVDIFDHYYDVQKKTKEALQYHDVLVNRQDKILESDYAQSCQKMLKGVPRT